MSCLSPITPQPVPHVLLSSTFNNTNTRSPLNTTASISSTTPTCIPSPIYRNGFTDMILSPCSKAALGFKSPTSSPRKLFLKENMPFMANDDIISSPVQSPKVFRSSPLHSPRVCKSPHVQSPGKHLQVLAENVEKSMNKSISSQSESPGRVWNINVVNPFSRSLSENVRALQSSSENVKPLQSVSENVHIISGKSFEITNHLHIPPENVFQTSSAGVNSSMRRKRPSRLAIPEFARLNSFGRSQQFSVDSARRTPSQINNHETEYFAVSSKKGKKQTMEDTHIAVTEFRGNSDQALFGVFDGHGGVAAAQFAAENICRHVVNAVENVKDTECSMEEAMQKSYMALDSEFTEKNLSSGACSLSVLLTKEHMIVANAGDCKAVLSRHGKAEALNTLHRASNEAERNRVEDLGGYVDCFNGVWRVQGTLAVTRSIGDINLKKWISAMPEVHQYTITDDCEFLIMASDGLWDKVSDQEAVDCVREFISTSRLSAVDDILTTRPFKAQKKYADSFPGGKLMDDKNDENGKMRKGDACNKLIETACSRGNHDDITVIVVPLRRSWQSRI